MLTLTTDTIDRNGIPRLGTARSISNSELRYSLVLLRWVGVRGFWLVDPFGLVIYALISLLGLLLGSTIYE
jgi:hypothetical protein